MNKNDSQNSFFSMVTGQTDQGTSAETETEQPLNGDVLQGKCSESAESIGRGVLLAEGSLPAEGSLKAEGSDMPHEARRVLVHLMRQGVVIASQKPKLFESVCRFEALVRRHLSEVYLQLVLDHKSGVAFVATSTSEHVESKPEANGFYDVGDDNEAEDFSALISRRTLSLYDTLLLLVLRKHYQERESAGEQKITVDIERLESYLTPFLPITDHASKDRKKLLARVKEMVRRKVLSTIRGSEDRYEITPIIRYVVSASFLESMLAEYSALVAGLADKHTAIDADNPGEISGQSTGGEEY